MVMDLQDVDETLEDAVARSHIRLFGSSSKSLSLHPSSNRHAVPPMEGDGGSQGFDEEDEEQGDDDLASDPDDLPYSEDENVELHFTGRSTHRVGHRSTDR